MKLQHADPQTRVEVDVLADCDFLSCVADVGAATASAGASEARVAPIRTPIQAHQAKRELQEEGSNQLPTAGRREAAAQPADQETIWLKTAKLQNLAASRPRKSKRAARLRSIQAASLIRHLEPTPGPEARPRLLAATIQTSMPQVAATGGATTNEHSKRRERRS